MGYINYVREMGESAFPGSLTDAIRPAMVHGLRRYMQTIGHLITNSKAIKLSVEEAKLAGTVTERILGHRVALLTDLADPYSAKGPFEALLQKMTDIASKWNGSRIWADMQKSFSAVMTQNRILEGVEKFATTKDRPYLAFLGIDQSMAERIATLFATHGETVEGVRVANTEQWTDAVARRTYRAAMNKDVDSILSQPGVADVPLFAHTPTGKLLLQFQSFNLASHQRVMMRGLQEDSTRFIGGMLAMTTMGMFATYLKAIADNRTDHLGDAGWLVGEGLDRSGVISVPMELANRFEKVTGFNPIKGPMKAFDKGSAESLKNQNRNEFGSMFGPTFGLGQDVVTTLGIPKTMLEGKDVSKSQKRAAQRLMPYESYAGVRSIMNYLVNPP